MEICGTHTMSIARYGLKTLFADAVSLVSGPGCPVCVTDQCYIECAVGLARGDFGVCAGAEARRGKAAPAPIIATYGDMVRVPGRSGSLGEARSRGAGVEVVSSADQAVELAGRAPGREVVFLAVGFETTAPGTAVAVRRAKREGVANFSVLTAHKLIVPAMHAILSDPLVRVDGFLCPGHVSVILGYAAFDEIVEQYARPCVVAGFDAAQIVAGVQAILQQLADDSPAACSVYPSVSREGNPTALELLDEVFTVADAPWRALGVIPDSGLVLRDEYAEFDAAKKFDLPEMPAYEAPGCRCADVLRGRCGPNECGLFAAACTPRDPVGPCMVSSEGACAAAYKYEKQRPMTNAQRLVTHG